jgi:DNA-binding transcriptional LysR family regulator
VATFDLKLLAIIDDLYRTRSVSHTADNLGVNQPAVSMSLARLRRHFNDPLFVKTPHGMEPTTRAIEIVDRLREAHRLIRSAVEHREAFEPATSTRMFRIASTEIGQVILLPRLMQRIRERAPRLCIEFSNFTEKSPSQLASGEMDLAVGFIPPLKTGFHRQSLFTDRFVCLVRANHPRIRQRLTIDRFEAEPHLVVATSGTGHTIVAKTLAASDVHRRVGLRVPNFLAVTTLLSEADFIATVPERFARLVEQQARLQVLEPPLPIPAYHVMQYWHERANIDAGNRWVRAQLAELFGEHPGRLRVVSEGGDRADSA